MENFTFFNETSLITGNSCYVLIKSCSFLNFRVFAAFSLISLRNTSIFEISQAKIENFTLFTGNLISLRNGSTMKISYFLIKNSVFLEDSLISNDFLSSFDCFFAENLRSNASLFEISGLANYSASFSLKNSLFYNISNENPLSALIIDVSIAKGLLSIELFNNIFLENCAMFSFFTVSLRTFTIKQHVFAGNYVEFAIFYVFSTISAQFDNLTFAHQNKNQFLEKKTSGSCALFENVWERELFNVLVFKCFAVDSTFGFQFSDFSEISSKLQQKYGWIYEKPSVISIKTSIFCNNSVFYQLNRNISGAFYVFSDSEMSVSQSFFAMNTIDSVANPSKTQGSVCINSLSSRNNLSISSSIFSSNAANFISNCVFFKGNALQIIASDFSNNRPIFSEAVLNRYQAFSNTFVRKSEALPSGFAGALRFQGAKLLIISCFFAKNEGYMGGALLIDGTENGDPAHLLINNTVFVENSAGTVGGAVDFTEDAKVYWGFIEKSVFLFNDARYGGAICTEFASADVFLEFFELFFFRNQAQYAGALLFHHNRGAVNISYSNFMENFAFLPSGMTLPVMCGALGLWGSNFTYAGSKFNYFKGNYVENGNGGSIAILSGNFLSENDVFEKNQATGKGAFFIAFSGNFRMFHGIIRGESRNSYAVLNDYSMFLCHNVTFLDTDAGNHFLIELYFESFVVADGLFIKQSIGGLLNFHEAYTVVNFINNSVFSSNFAESFLCNLFASTVFFENCSFFNDSAYLFAVENSQFSVVSCEFSKQSCGFSFESYAFSAFHAEISINSSYFEDFQALEAFALFFCEYSVISLRDSLIKNIVSSSTFSGEVSFLRNSQIHIENTLFLNLYAAFLKLEASSLKFLNSSIENSLGKLHESLIKASETLEIYVENSVFSGNCARNHGGCMRVSSLSEQTAREITISRSVFTQCGSLFNGGALYFFENSQILLENCLFLNNFAANGGAIYYETSKENASSPLTLISLNYFVNNSAIFSGGALKWTKTLPKLNESLLFLRNNCAKHGANLASSAMRVLLSVFSRENGNYSKEFDSQTDDFSFALRNLRPGVPANRDLVFKYVDFYNQTIAVFDNSIETFLIISEDEREAGKLAISSSFSRAFLLNPSYFTAEGVINLTNLTIFTAPQRKTAYLLLKPAFLSFFSVYQRRRASIEADFSSNYAIILAIELFPCEIGEISSGNACFFCEAGKFSASPSENMCQSCPKHARCPGGSLTVLDAGYWRKSRNSTIFFCETSEKNCQGGENATCKGNFVGPFCRVCRKGFYEVQGTECFECDGFIWNIMRSLAIFVGFSVVLIFLVKSSVDNLILYQRFIAMYHDENLKENIVKNNLDLQSIYLKILVNYFQIYSFLQINPFETLVFNEFLNNVSIFSVISGKILAFSCIFKDFSFADSPFFDYISLNLLPILLIFAAFFGLKAYYHLRGRSVSSKNHLFSVIFGVFFTVLPSILAQSIKNLTCFVIEPGYEVLKYSPIHECDENYRQIAYKLVWPVMFFWALVFPGCVFAYLAAKRDKLYEFLTFQRFNFIYIGYKTRFFYWEMLILAKKFLISVLVLANLDDFKAFLVNCVIFAAYIALFGKCQPFLWKILNKLEFQSCVCTIFVAFFAALSKQKQGISREIAIFSSVCSFFLNFGFVSLWFWQFSRFLLRKYLGKFAKACPKVFEICGRVAGFFRQIIENCKENARRCAEDKLWTVYRKSNRKIIKENAGSKQKNDRSTVKVDLKFIKSL